MYSYCLCILNFMYYVCMMMMVTIITVIIIIIIIIPLNIIATGLLSISPLPGLQKTCPARALRGVRMTIAGLKHIHTHCL